MIYNKHIILKHTNKQICFKENELRLQRLPRHKIATCSSYFTPSNLPSNTTETSKNQKELRFVFDLFIILVCGYSLAEILVKTYGCPECFEIVIVKALA